MTVHRLLKTDHEPQGFTGLSTDTKPTPELQAAGARFYETDTGMVYWWDGDSWQHGQITIPVEHHRIHNGQAFFATHYFSAVANDASAELLIRANSGMHCLYEIAAGGDVEVNIFEEPTATADGPVVTHSNRNRYSTNASNSVITHSPTISVDGVNLGGGGKLIPGGSGGNAGGGSDGGFGRELTCRSGRAYLVRSTNRSGQARDMSISLDWYQFTTT
jgi:hypothetical protein